MNKTTYKENSLKLAAVIFKLILSLLALCCVISIKVIAAVLSEESNDNSSQRSDPYVLDADGNEIIDDNVTYVYDIDDPINLKDPI